MNLEYMFLNFYYTYFIKISLIEWWIICLTLVAAFIIQLFKTHLQKHICFEVISYKTGILKGFLFSYYEFIIIVTVINRKSNGERLYNYNLFWTIKEVWKNHNLLLLQEIIINILMFIPIGLLLSGLFYKKAKLFIMNILLVSLGLSVFIEVTQYIFYKGTMELDDVIYNCIGGATGLFFYWITHKVLRKVSRK